MRVLMLSPGFPVEMPRFTRGLAEVGARVYGVGDQPRAMVPELARHALSDYLEVRDLWDEQAVIDQVRRWVRGAEIHRVECLWEPGMLLAARLREALGASGMRVSETVPLRDKEAMKQMLDRDGIRTPRHARAASGREVRACAERIGFSLIVKPIAGAGSADTHRVANQQALEQVLRRIRHVQEVSVEEFIEGEEFTFDTICAGGEILFENVAWYRPKPLIARTQAWISPQTVTLREIDDPQLAAGCAMGRAVLRALSIETGFSHMEWFRTPAGEAVFGEIGGRPPGARSVDIMNFASDIDVYRGWAEAVCHGRFSQPIVRKYNAAVIFKRAQGEGRIQRIQGLDRLIHDFGRHLVANHLAQVGEPRRDWKQSLISDGYLIVRHPDLQTTLHMADRVGTDLQLFAG